MGHWTLTLLGTLSTEFREDHSFGICLEEQLYDIGTQCWLDRVM